MSAGTITFEELKKIQTPLATSFGENPPIHLLALAPLINAIREVFPWVNPKVDARVNTITSGFNFHPVFGHKINGLLMDVGNVCYQHRKDTVIEILNGEFKYFVVFKCWQQELKFHITSSPSDITGCLSVIMNNMISSVNKRILSSSRPKSFLFTPYFYTQNIKIPNYIVTIPPGQTFWMNPNQTSVRITKFSFDGRKRPTNTWFHLDSAMGFQNSSGQEFKPIQYTENYPKLTPGFIPDELT